MTTISSTKKADFSRLIYESVLWRGLFYVSSLLLNVLIARYYQASASGWIFFVFNYYTLFIEVLGFSMESGINFYASKNEIAVPKLLVFSLALSLAALAPVVIFFRLYVPQELKGIPPGFILFSAVSYICGYILNNCCSALFYAKRNFILPNMVFIVINIVLIILLISTGGVGGAGHDLFIRMLFASFFVQGIVLLIAALIMLTGGQAFSLPGRADLEKVARYSVQAFIANIVFYLLYRIDYWFVEHYCRPEELGNYIQVARLVQLFLVLPTIMAGVIFPATAGGQQAEINRSLKTIAASLLFLYAVVCGLLALTGQWLFPFVFGKSFDKMYGPFLLLIPGIFALSTLYLFAAYYAGKNRVRVNVQGSLCALVVVVSGDILFIPHYGIKAAALVSSVGYTVYQVYVLMVFKREYQLSWTYFFSVTKKDLYWIKDLVLANTFKKNNP